jgi:WD40 repeat protein
MPHDQAPLAAEFSPDGRWLVAGTEEGARLWDLSQSPATSRLLPHDSSVACVAFSPTSDVLATGTTLAEADLLNSGSHVFLWRIREEKPFATVNLEANVNALSFNAAADALAVGSSDGAIGVWDMRTNGWRFHRSKHHEGINSLRFSPDGKWLVSAGRDEVLQALSAFTGESRYSALPHRETIFHSEFTRDGKRFVTQTASGVLRVWDFETGLPLTESLREAPTPLLGWRPPANATILSPDGQRVVVIGEDCAARVLELRAPPMPAPVWLADLADAIAGQHLTAGRQTEEVSWPEYIQLRDRLLAAAGDDFYGRWLRWFFADRNARAISPWSKQTMARYAEERIRENTLDSLFEAARLQPTNAIMLARLGAALSKGKAPGLLEFTDIGPFLLHRAEELAPSDPEVQRIASSTREAR